MSDPSPTGKEGKTQAGLARVVPQDEPLRMRPRVWQDDVLRQVQSIFDSHFARDGSLRRVLDAGAGLELPLHVPLDAHLIAVDLSTEALARNENADEKIVADIQSFELPAESVDAVICWWVLEHVPQPRRALQNFAEAVRLNGLIVVGVPYLWGFKGMVTKATPYRFHLWLARRSNPSAGTEGKGPFPTFLSHDVSPRRLRQIARENSLEPLFEKTHSMEPEQRLPVPLRLLWKLLGRAVTVITFGRYDPLLSEHVVVFKKI